MSFTLTPAKPTTHDPNLIPKTADPSWFDKAEVAWIDAQCFAYDVRDARERLAEVRSRIVNGKKWLAEEDDEDGMGHRLYNELVNLERAIEIEERCLRHACWHHCLATYASLAHCPDPYEAAVKLGLLYSVAVPQAVWMALFPDEEPPGEYPPGDKENWIDAGRYVEVWDREQRIGMLQQKKRRRR